MVIRGARRHPCGHHRTILTLHLSSEAVQEAEMSPTLATPDQIALAYQLRSLRHDGSQIPTGQLVSMPLALEDAIEVQRQLSKLEGVNDPAWKVAKSPDGEPVIAPLHPYFDNPSGAVVAWRRDIKLEIEREASVVHSRLPIRRTYPSNWARTMCWISRCRKPLYT